MKNSIIESFILFIAILLFAIQTPAHELPILWESEFITALNNRDSVFGLAGLDSTRLSQFPVSENDLTTNRLSFDTMSTWYCFCVGISKSNDTTSLSSIWFSKAITATRSDPGQIFALSLEFQRCGLPMWQEKCLTKLRYLSLLRGIESVPLVSQILLHNDVYLSSYSLNGSQRMWAGTFDRHCVWPLILDIKSDLMQKSPNVFSKTRELYYKIVDSWESQLELAYQFHRWLTMVLSALVFGIIGCLLAKYLFQSLHTVSEILPRNHSIRTRTFLISALFFSFIFCGFFALIWITFFLLWRHLRGSDKVIASIALGIFMLYPLNAKIGDMICECNSPSSPSNLFKKAIDEGYYPALEEHFNYTCQSDSMNFLTQTALAVLYIKKSDMPNALSHIKIARQLSPYDPVVLTILGNIYYQSGLLIESKTAYGECIERNPTFAPAYFNCGQYFFNTMETAKGVEYIAKAAKLNPALINSHIKTSDDFFSKDWPIARQLILPDYQSGYFWKHLFIGNANNWANVDKKFGAAFLGFSIVWYGILSLFLFFILIVADITVWSRDAVKKVYSCKLCQAPICRKCKRGSICQTCFNATQHIRNESIRQRIMAKIQFKNRRIASAAGLALDVLFPGAGMVFRNKPLWLSIPFLCITAIVYGTYISIFSPSIVYPSWLLHGVLLPCFIACVLYNAFFIGRTVSLLIKEIKNRGEDHGIAR